MRKIFLFLMLSLPFHLQAEVKPANYDFSLESLKVFKPGSTREAFEKKYGKGEVWKKENKTVILKYYVAQIRYKFPVFVQVFDGKVVDFFARLPTYFLHDLFHQSIINRVGKQDKYFRVENNALYKWVNKKGIDYTYSGTCTITCFPIFYSEALSKPPSGMNKYKPLVAQFNSSARHEDSLGRGTNL